MMTKKGTIKHYFVRIPDILYKFSKNPVSLLFKFVATLTLNLE